MRCCASAISCSAIERTQTAPAFHMPNAEAVCQLFGWQISANIMREGHNIRAFGNGAGSRRAPKDPFRQYEAGGHNGTEQRGCLPKLAIAQITDAQGGSAGIFPVFLYKRFAAGQMPLTWFARKTRQGGLRAACIFSPLEWPAPQMGKRRAGRPASGRKAYFPGLWLFCCKCPATFPQRKRFARRPSGKINANCGK